MRSKFTKFLKVQGLSLFFFVLSFCGAQAQGVNYRVHGMFITNFAKYVDWPGSQSNINIAVLAPQDVVMLVASITKGRKVKDAQLNVRKINAVSQISDNVHIVFLPAVASGQFEAVKKAIGDRPILLVTEKAGLAKKGGMINFVQVGGKMRFELNQSVIEAHNMQVSSNLIALSIKV